MKLIKRNKRLWIENESGEVIYTPPDFIRLHGRVQMLELVEDLKTMDRLAAILKFETKVRP